MARASMQAGIEQRRTEVARAANITVKYSVVEGFIPLEGAGETITVVNFPIQYIDKPVFTFGHELGDNAQLVNGSFPTVSATVVSWVMVDRDKSRRYFAGVTLAVVVEGAVTNSVIHFQFTGRAFRGPVVAATGTLDTL